MPTLILTRKEFAPGNLPVVSVLVFASLMMLTSLWIMSSHGKHMAFRSGAANLVAGESHLSMVAPKAVLPNVPGPDLMQFPFAGNKLLQFTSAGHVLGFAEKEVFIASGDHALKVEFVGARLAIPHAQGKVKMLASSERGGRPLGKVTYSDVWDGITVVYEGSPGAVVKSTYYIAPGKAQAGYPRSSADQILFRYNVPVRLDDKGNLVMSFETGEMCESAPVAWQEAGGQRIPVEVAYCLFGEKEVGFSLGSYDPSHPLVIDPRLVWNTFMGCPGGDDGGNEIALDLSGNIYVAGHSSATWGTPVNSFTAGGNDGFVAKLNSSGVRQWHTFMGSAGNDVCYGISLDSNGNIYVGGWSSATWGFGPIVDHTGGASNNDVFAAKLNPTGVRLWHTFMGAGGAHDQGGRTAVDGSGNVYVCGWSAASWGVPPNIKNSHTGDQDAFVAKLNDLGAYQWNAFMGAAGNDNAHRIRVESGGTVYLVGESWGTWGAPKNPYKAGLDAFVAQFNSSGVSQWNTFIGSGGNDVAYGIALDNAGNVYVAGQADASWEPPVNPFVGGVEAFAAKLNNSGVTQWHTFMGSAATDTARMIAVDSAGKVYVLGSSAATWGNPLNPHAGGSDWDAFVAKLTSEGVRQWNTFMGSTSGEDTAGIVADNSGFVYVTGNGAATWGTPVNNYAGGNDAYVAKHTTSDIKAKQIYFSPVHNLKE